MLFAFSGSASASVACPEDLTPATTATASAAVVAIVCDINVVRVREGLKPLRWDWRLWAPAQQMAEDMGTRHYWSHVTPEGVHLEDRVAPTKYTSQDDGSWLLAENIGWGTAMYSTPLSIVLGWLNSPEHRENLLDPELEDIGVGMFEGSPVPEHTGGMIYVADFGRRAEPEPVTIIPTVATVKPWHKTSCSKATSSSESSGHRTTSRRSSPSRAATPMKKSDLRKLRCWSPSRTTRTTPTRSRYSSTNSSPATSRVVKTVAGAKSLRAAASHAKR
jgi:uncharacterized protein YkwD